MIENMRMIHKSEECIGKYMTREQAKKLAELETQKTGQKHHAFFTHYLSPYEPVDIMHWTVIITKE